jgi:hypothetical protein
MNSASATTITVNTALFAAGDTVQIQNVGAGVCTVTAGTATVSTSATLALKQYDAGTLYFNTTNAAIFFAVDAADGMANVLTTTGDMVYSSSGTTAARLGIGSTSQVLTVAGGIPSWATPATPSAALTIAQIASGSMPAASSLSLTGLSSYDTLIVRLDGLTWATNNASIMVTINSDTGANYELVGSYNQTTFSTGYYSTATNYFYAGFGAASQTRTDTDNGRFYVFTNCSAAGFTTATVQEKYLSSGGDTPNASSVGIYKSAAAVSSLQFKTSTGNNYTAGNYIIWGG